MPVRVAGRLVTRGFLHHAAPRYLVKFFASTKEIVCRLSGPLHAKFHRGLDLLMRRDGFPPMNQKQKWLDHMRKYPQKTALIRMRLRQYTAQFEVENNVRGLLEAVDESLP